MSDMEVDVASPAITGESVDKLLELVKKFQAAVSQIDSVENTESEPKAELRAVIEACTRQFLPELRRILNLPEHKDPKKAVLPSPKNKTWKNIQGTVKTYLLALIKCLSDADLRELNIGYMPEVIAYYSCFPKLSKVAMERMIDLWRSEAESIRVIAGGCITRLILHVPPKQVEDSLARMYAVFRKSCKVTTVESLPLINFLKHSLVEMMSLKPDLAHKCAFASIKGMAKKLRNASEGYKRGKNRKANVTARKREKEKKGNDRPIYNWLHLHSMSFWTVLIGRLKSDPNMQKLVHHIVELINDTIRANSSVQYFPLRFGCLRMLIQLCEAMDLFVPVLPFLLEVIDCSVLQTNAAHNSKKRFNFDAILKVTKTEVHERAFLDEAVDNFCELTLRYCVCFSHSIAFPELVQTSVEHIKNFVKTCPMPAYTSKMKMLVEKLEEHSKLMRKKRAAASLGLHDERALQLWEQNLKLDKNPLVVYFNAWKKKHLEKKDSYSTKGVIKEVRTQRKEKRIKMTANDDGGKADFDTGDKTAEDEVSYDKDEDIDEVEDTSDDDDDESSVEKEGMEFEDMSDNEDNS